MSENTSHRWVMVGYWHITSEQIQESLDNQTQLQLARPDEVEGPGCMNCEIHWMTGKDTECPFVTGGTPPAHLN
jgi:hypothetical protein